MVKEYRIATAAQLQTYLKSLRKAEGLTQSELGARVGNSQRMIAKIEAHPERASFERILSMLSALECDLLIRARTSTRRAGSIKPVEEP
jgi:HTH-type transcriptional regulator / antitoxin HipB